ncbi:hypothetical protein [Tahibacter caeni]|uniref:hypothetical protein n=1 Tax=Tahibacter caeni TaxID=1453545 RepID=UPI0021489CFD|nr:hypothetical protein [Tahibacter caeni]
MRTIGALALFALAFGAAASDTDEARIEQLMLAPDKPAAPAKANRKADAKAAKNDTDAVASLVGQRVAVETRQRGIYIGTLTAATRDVLTLLIQLPARDLSYSLPRGDVAAVTPR